MTTASIRTATAAKAAIQRAAARTASRRLATTAAKAAAASTATSSNPSLLSKLVPPSKIASNLDWKKSTGATVLTLNVHTDRIGLSLGHHPSSGIPPDSFEDIPLRGGPKCNKINTRTRQQLSDIVQNNNVCGFVVNWPIQHDTGRLGYAAGRVLFTLEQLINTNDDGSSNMAKDDTTTSMSGPLNSRNRPICLWNGQHVPTSDSTTDIWGRDPALGHPQQHVDDIADTHTDAIHTASTEQYHEDEMIIATQIWEDFVHSQWPDIASSIDYNNALHSNDRDMKPRSRSQNRCHYQYDSQKQQRQGYEHNDDTTDDCIHIVAA